MKILFNDLIHDATISSLNGSESYSVQNLASRYLRKRYQATGNSDTITLTYASDVTIDSLFWGYTNLTTMLVKFYNSDDELIELVYFENGNVGHYYGYPDQNLYGYGEGDYYGYYDRLSDHVYDPVSWHFPEAVTFRYVEFEIVSTESPLILGAIGLGISETMPNPLEEWPESWDDRSKVSYSEAGQSQAQYVEPMRVYDFDFDGISRERMNELREVYKTYGIGAIIWFDPTEANHEFITPMYAVLDSWGDNKKRGKSYGYSLTIKEAR